MKPLRLSRGVVGVILAAFVGLLLLHFSREETTATIDMAPASGSVTDNAEAAPDEQQPFAGTQSVPLSSLSAISRMAGGLIVVLLVMYLVFLAVRRTMGNRGETGTSRRSLGVVETVHLAPKKSVSIIRVADRAVLIGVTDQQMTFLADITSDELEAMRASGNAASVRVPFGDLLNQAAKLTGFGKVGRAEPVQPAS